jgi:hypothetical protein
VDSALILGLFALARPLVALSGAAAAAWFRHGPLIAAISFGAAAVPAVEPLTDRMWYANSPQRPDTVHGSGAVDSALSAERSSPGNRDATARSLR